MSGSQQLLLGGKKAAEAVYIEDIFSTYLYTGNGSTQTITNGIDLLGKGGLVWQKARSSNANHLLTDTVRGSGYSLNSNSTLGQFYNASIVSSFNSNGFTDGASQVNGVTYASWTFRKQPKFFDVVTYTGDGNNAGQTINHNLGSVPGFIICKSTSASGNWAVCARTGAGTYATGLSLNLTDAALYSGSLGDAPTATTFSTAGIFDSVGGGNYPNVNGVTYVAYLFAHNAGGFGLTGTDNVISCGSFNPTSNGSVDLGYEPQWIIAKKATGTGGSWFMWDSMRGWPAGRNVTGQVLRANETNAEAATSGIAPTATGFDYAALGDTWIYIAIRRGPMKTPTSGTSVFAPVVQTGSTNFDVTFSSIPYVDNIISWKNKVTGGTYNAPVWNDRLRGFPIDMTGSAISNNPGLSSALTSYEGTGSNPSGSNYLSGVTMNRAVWGGGWTNYRAVFYGLRRAPGFMDVVCYTGDATGNRKITHNLGVAPELLIVKKRSSATFGSWRSYAAPLGATQAIDLNSNAAAITYSIWNDTAPTATQFTVQTNYANSSGDTFVTYLFASCPGVSKVTSFTGTGTLQTINCGFTGGARFVLIKRTDSTGNWFVWDSSRGLSSSDDPYLMLNSTAAEVTSTNWVDTTATGFQVTAASGNDVNINGASYIALAIA